MPFGVWFVTSRLFAALLPSVSVGSSPLNVSVDLRTSEFAIAVNGEVSQAGEWCAIVRQFLASFSILFYVFFFFYFTKVWDFPPRPAVPPAGWQAGQHSTRPAAL